MNKIKKQVSAIRTYENGVLGNKIGVAVLDTGVYQHEDICDNVKLFKDYVNYKTKMYDDNGHGTHICGIVAGKNGIAPKADIISIKVLDRNGNGTANEMIKGLQWIKDNYHEWNIRIINISVGFVVGADIEKQNIILEQIEELWDLGIVVVAAAGNNGPMPNSVTVPGIARKIITVGASDDKAKKYSGVGPTECCIVKPEILAPGTKIISTAINKNGYISKSGTSMATPIVSGAIALALEVNSKLKPVEIKLLLYKTVDKSNKYAWGVLNIDRFVEAAKIFSLEI